MDLIIAAQLLRLATCIATQHQTQMALAHSEYERASETDEGRVECSYVGRFAVVSYKAGGNTIETYFDGDVEVAFAKDGYVE